MIEGASPRRLPKVLAIAWLALLVVLGLQQLSFWRAMRIDTDIMALLPGAAGDALAAAAQRNMADGTSRQVVVLLGHPDWPRLKESAKRFEAALESPASPLRVAGADGKAMAAATAELAPYRRALLTPSQRTWLDAASEQELLGVAMARLYGLAPAGGMLPWQDDPLGLWPTWWQDRIGSGLHMRDGWTTLERDALHWIVLRFETRAGAFQLDGKRPLADALDAALSVAASRDSGATAVRVLRGGVPLHAEAAAVRASIEVSSIGVGSLLAVMLLVWLAFRSLRPLLLVGLSLLVGCAAGLAMTTLVFGRVHLLALVFGASLVGVAVDYGLHYFAHRQGDPLQQPAQLLRRLRAGLLLALCSSMLAYLTIALAPLPGLRQMAVFSASGLAAAGFTVLLWFPYLDGGAARANRFSRFLGCFQLGWARWRQRKGLRNLLMLGFAAFTIGGLFQLRSEDSLRTLHSSPLELWQQEAEIGLLLGLPSPAQYFVIEGESSEQLRRREEALTRRLQMEVDAGRLEAYRAVTDWFPSAAQQHADWARASRAESVVLARASEILGEPLSSASDSFVELPVRLDQPWSDALQPLWLGDVDGRQGSMVLLQGLHSGSDLAALAGLSTGLDGVRWIDRSSEISRLLGHYRVLMGGLLLFGYVVVGAALYQRFRREAWRALLPTALAALTSLAALGWLGEPLHLFNVLAQMLLLGIGIDYGVFTLEHGESRASWLAVTLGAASTALSFGLLSFSATPALHGFGLSMLLGIAAVWLLTPLFRPLSDASNFPSQPDHS